MATLSVIVVAHNEERDLARAVKSVLAQTHSDFELIIVDDASTDHTWEVMQSFDDPRIVRHQRLCANGAGAARNTAITLAKSQWLAFLDADDSWHPEKLARQWQIVSQGQVDAVLCGFQLFRKLNDSPEIYLNNLPAPWPKGIVTGCHFAPGSGLLIKKSCFETIGGFDESLKRLEDWDWWLRAAPHLHCHNISIALMDIHMGSQPTYEVVAAACRILQHKHAQYLLRRWGISALVQFLITLQFEYAAAAFNNRRTMQCTWHLICSGMAHKRFWQRLKKLVLSRHRT